MGRTVYFLDGTSETLTHSSDREKLALSLTRILEERLGRDTADLLRELLDPDLNGMDDLAQELKGCELSCDSYRACLQDVSDGMERLLKILSAHRINRRKFILTIQSIKARISNEL